MAGRRDATLPSVDRVVPAVHSGLSGDEGRHDERVGHREVVGRSRIRVLALLDRNLSRSQLGYYQSEV